MSENYLCISIPEELQQYKKIVNLIDNNDNAKVVPNADFGVRLIRDKYGNPVHAEYYSDTGELLKKIFYDGSIISKIENYRNNILYSLEEYKESKLTKENTYNNAGELTSTIKYEYDKSNRIKAITKIVQKHKYDVQYGYDELGRVNERILKYNNDIIEEQRYRLDILDRIVEYRDKNQIIRIHQINQYNELVSYTITDTAGNTIAIINKFLCKDYIGTELDLNGHKTTIKDRAYVDNPILKRPTTSKEDLNFSLSNIFNKSMEMKNIETKRISNQQIIEKIIGDKVISPLKTLPISLRKLQLICTT